VVKVKHLYGAVPDLTGKIYGRLTVLGYSPSVKHQLSRWVVLCKCGKKGTIYGMSLSSGKSQSCGCLQKDKSTKHGNSNHPLYKIWTSINYRCNNIACADYCNYGERGIKNLFSSFEHFCQCMGERPLGYTVERLDVNGHYEPSNCVWIENKKQSLNRRCNIPIKTKEKICELAKTITNKSMIARLAGVGRTSVDRVLKNCV
jgi:hypothetical protein